jgi:hypothetical protein
MCVVYRKTMGEEGMKLWVQQGKYVVSRGGID